MTSAPEGSEDLTGREKRIRFVAIYVLMDNGIDRDLAWFDAYATFPPLQEIPRSMKRYRKELSAAAKSHAKQTRRLMKIEGASNETVEALARRTLEQYEAIAHKHGDDRLIPAWTKMLLDNRYGPPREEEGPTDN